jgi:hypothetical protein
VDYDDRGLAAMPKLVGGPKYSRPPVLGLPHAERPLDPDDLPLLSERTPEDHALAESLGLHPAAGSAGAQGSTAVAVESAPPEPRRRGFGGLFRARGDQSG